MNIVNKLTLRQLLLNKRRTLVTIIGTIISVAMITAVASLGVSFMDMMQRQVISDEGEWHVLYENVNRTQLEAIKNDEETKDVILSRDVGYALLGASQNNNKPYIYIEEYNSEGFSNFPVKLKEGRYPDKNNEIIISEAIITNGQVDYKIGDILSLDIGQRVSKDEQEADVVLSQKTQLQKYQGKVQEALTKENTKIYTVVGIMERPTWEYTWSPGYTAISYIDESMMNSKKEVNVSVLLDDVDFTLFENAKDIASQNDIKKVSFHENLLRYYGVVESDRIRGIIFNLSAIITVIIMVGSISLIYNAFAISVSERSRHLGMLSSVGATKRQKKNSVFFEGTLIGLISIPIGIIAGLVGIDTTFMFINSIIKEALSLSESLRLIILPETVLIATSVSIITIFTSTYIPAKRASNISAIDAIRQTADVKITQKDVKTSILTRNIFGIEGELGLKNLKRNKSRYRATVLSLIISMILFLSVSYFTSSLEKSILLSQDGVNYDIEVFFNDRDKTKQEDLIRKITSLDNIVDANSIASLDVRSWIQEDSIADYLKGDHEEILKNGKYPYNIKLIALDDQALMAYAKEVGVDFKKLMGAEEPFAIIIDTVRFEEAKTGRIVESKVINTEIGQKLDLEFYDSEFEKYIPIDSVEIAALVDKVPMGISSINYKDSFNVIVSEDAFYKIIQDNMNMSESVNRALYLKSDNPLKLQEDSEEIQGLYGEDEMAIYNIYMNRKREEQMIVLMSVFTYAFVLLIASICVANIFNTISTSIALRKREFAMLKSVGMTPKEFNKMINYESLFYGIKALLYGLPISFVVMYLIHKTLMVKFGFVFEIPWVSVSIAIIAVFVIVGVSMLYSSKKIKRENIIDVLKQEII